MSALLLRLAGPTQAWDSRRRASQYDSVPDTLGNLRHWLPLRVLR